MMKVFANSSDYKTRAGGFTLVELMIVIVIIAVLASIAIPSYQESVRKSRRADGTGALVGFANAMERYFTRNNSFLGAAVGNADTGVPAIFANQAPIDGGTAYYNLTISAATASSYTLTATAVGPQVDDGDLTLTNVGARTWNGNLGWD